MRPWRSPSVRSNRRSSKRIYGVPPSSIERSDAAVGDARRRLVQIFADGRHSAHLIANDAGRDRKPPPGGARTPDAVRRVGNQKPQLECSGR